ncbi:hypothetical protein EDB89DRAFT_1911202 [Lactarius sanguifluus]|nr:hypothetical protein EDB89DRAFT_1911202 [Lactarius sanguifluus]
MTGHMRGRGETQINHHRPASLKSDPWKWHRLAQLLSSSNNLVSLRIEEIGGNEFFMAEVVRILPSSGSSGFTSIVTLPTLPRKEGTLYPGLASSSLNFDVKEYSNCSSRTTIDDWISTCFVNHICVWLKSQDILHRVTAGESIREILPALQGLRFGRGTPASVGAIHYCGSCVVSLYRCTIGMTTVRATRKDSRYRDDSFFLFSPSWKNDCDQIRRHTRDGRIPNEGGGT